MLFLIYSIWLSFKIAGTQEMFFANSEVYFLACLFILTDTIVFFLKAKTGIKILLPKKLLKQHKFCRPITIQYWRSKRHFFCLELLRLLFLGC
jgi:hypothetical protein